MSIADRLKLSGRRARPVIFQTEMAECGLACLTMIANHHGSNLTLDRVRQRMSVSVRGMTAQDLLQLAEGLGLRGRALRLEVDQVNLLKKPCILHWDFKHFVVLDDMNARYVVLRDPGAGVRKVAINEFSKHFTGVALELHPGPDLTRSETAQRLSIFHLARQVLRGHPGAAQLVTFAVLFELLGLLLPMQIKWIADNVLPGDDIALLSLIGCSFLVVVVFHAIYSFLRQWSLFVLTTSAETNWLSALFSHLLRLPISFFEKRSVSDLLSRFNAIITVQRIVSGGLVQSGVDGMFAFGALLMLYAISPLLAVISTFAVAIAAGISVMLYPAIRAAITEQTVYQAKQTGQFLQTVVGIQAVRLFDRTSSRFAEWSNALVEQYNARIREQRLALASQAIQQLASGLERVVVIWVGSNFVLRQDITLGALLAFLAYKEMLVLRANALLDKHRDLALAEAQIERFSDIVAADAEAPDPAHQVIVEAQLRIALRDVTFRYSDAEPLVLNRLNFDIAQSECVAITGPSGSGKSTFAKILVGLLQPAGGEILVNGVSVLQLGLNRYRGMMGCVLQGDVPFEGSIAQNISFFDPSPEDPWIEHCAKVAGLHDEIVAMPMGYNSILPPFGVSLSGGQKQRLLLARALYRRPRFLVLDEATSHLDLQREVLVNQALREMGLTMIVVAHRPNTIGMADRVLRLEGGQFVMQSGARTVEGQQSQLRAGT